VVVSTVGDEKAGHQDYQEDHMQLLFNEGFSFSGYERNHLFLNLEGDRFKDISGVSGLDSLLDGRAAVTADLDNDGDQDVFVTNLQGEGHLLFRNNVGQNNHFIRIAVEGKASGRDAFGAIVRLKTAEGILTRVKSGGNGFLAQHDPRLLFGLGQAEEAEWIEITWPSGNTQRFGPVAAGTSFKIVEGIDALQRVPEKLSRLVDPISSQQALWRKLKVAQDTRFPQLEMHPLEGSGAALRSGVSYFLNLWATWCIPCRKEMPELQNLLPQFRAKGIQVVGLSLDQEVEADEVLGFARELGVTYPLYRIGEEAIATIFGEEVFIPLSILIDEKGQVVDVFEGWSPQSQQRIHQLLE
jgi:thiol-disulfide isomerase/thioredoxin